MSTFDSTKKAIVYFSNGKSFLGKSFGADGSGIGEVIFNTSMTGYQEITSDPSYAGQLITFCMPEIGNVGANDDDMESNSIFANGIIARAYNDNYSNFRATSSYSSFLKNHNKVGIYDVDTRAIVSMIRDEGSLMAVISTTQFDTTILQKMINEAPSMDNINFNEQVSTKEPYTHNCGTWNNEKLIYNKPPASKNKILAIDFGIKKNILNELTQAGLEVEVIPYDFDLDNIISRYDSKEIKGIFLSNGPGDPKVLKDKIAGKIKKIADYKIPIFGICFGHQMLSIAYGFDTYKLKFGHHGGNHPIVDTLGKVEITAQNHLYNVPDEIKTVADVIATNLFDNTIEGVFYKDSPILSIQYHPESSPGPSDSKSYFTQFANMVNK
jgi:carbamoyl-phosphate synthase small subunit